MNKRLRVIVVLLFQLSFFCPIAAARQEAGSKPSKLDFDAASVFDEVISNVATNFFDRNFDIPAWRAVAVQARPKALAATSHDEFSEIINALLKTLNASHTKYFSKLDPRRYQLLGVFHKLYPTEQADLFIYDGIGIDTKTIEGSIYVTAVFDGLPAHKAGVKFGDKILNVDGNPFHPIQSFAGKADSTTSLKIRRGKSELTIKVVVERLDGRTMFETALEASQQIFESNGKKIAYLHVWSYAGAKYQETIRAAILWGELSQCDALILDIRDGWGGADLNYLNLLRPPILEIASTPRSGPPRNYTGVWGKPVALITNGGTTSGKELFTFGFKKLKLGKVFGEPTAGAVVAGRCFLLGNEDVLYVAVHDLRVDGVRLEGKGVAPDVHIKRPTVPAATTDPQLEQAIEFLGKQS